VRPTVPKQPKMSRCLGGGGARKMSWSTDNTGGRKMSIPYENWSASTAAMTQVPAAWQEDGLHRQPKRGIELQIPLRTLVVSAGLGAVLLVASTAATICVVEGCGRGSQASSNGLGVGQKYNANSSSPCSASWRETSGLDASSVQQEPAATTRAPLPQSQDTKGTGMVEASLFLGKKRTGLGTTVVDVNRGPATWQVVHHGFLMVRSANSTGSKVIGMKARCIMVVGERDGDWVRLAREPGFMLISKDDGTSMMAESPVGYSRLREGTCADRGLHVISDSASCKAAALAMGFPDATAQMIQDPDKPEGCYMLGDSLWLSINEANNGQGAKGGREPLCSTQPEPILEPCRSFRTVQEVERTKNTTPATPERKPDVAMQAKHKLFCFSLIEPESYEIELLTVQMENSASIFRCDSSTVLSVGTELSVGSMWRTVAIPRPSDSALQAVAPSNALLATQAYVQTLEATLMYQEAWALLMKKGTLWEYDWTVKVASDAVFLPDRLLKRLEGVTVGPITGQQLHFVQDCRSEERKRGSIDVFSNAAMRIFQQGETRCKRELTWHAWSHSYFMTRCFRLLGILGPGSQVSDNIFGAGPCHPSSCDDPSRVSFYGFRDADQYVKCMESANEEDLEDLWENVDNLKA